MYQPQGLTPTGVTKQKTHNYLFHWHYRSKLSECAFTRRGCRQSETINEVALLC